MVLSQLSKPIEVLIKIQQHHIVNKNTWNKKDSVEGQPPAFQMVRKGGCFLYGDVHVNKFKHVQESQGRPLGRRGLRVWGQDQVPSEQVSAGPNSDHLGSPSCWQTHRRDWKHYLLASNKMSFITEDENFKNFKNSLVESMVRLIRDIDDNVRQWEQPPFIHVNITNKET